MATPAPSLFAPFITGGDVEDWCMETLKEWSGTYLAEVERQHSLPVPTLPRIRSWVVAPDFDKWVEDQLPAIMLISVGLAEPPLKQGGGSYRARWQMGLACITAARTQSEAHRLAGLYVTAHRELLKTRQSLGGRAAGIDWQDEDYTALPFVDSRMLGQGRTYFTVQVNGVGSAYSGPTTADEPLVPDTAPWPLDPTVATHEETVENYPPPATLPE